MSCKTLIVISLAAMDSLWIQEVSGGSIGKMFSTDGWKIDDLSDDGDSIFGSHDIQIGNIYPDNTGGRTFFGSRDVQIGNIYPENSQGTNSYGPTLIQKGNVYRGIGGSTQFGASVTQVGNVYPKNLEKGDTFAPVVVQEGNVYALKNVSENIIFGAVVNQTNNTYPKELEGNTEALKPVIIQSENIFLDPPGKNSVGSVINQNNNRFHPSKGHKWRHAAATYLHSGGKIKVRSPLPSLGMMKREHEGMKKKIDFHIRTDKSTSKRCTNGMMDSERLDRIVSLKLEVERELTFLKALLQINRNRRVICDSIPAQCAKHDEVRKWISGIRLILLQKTEKSKGIWLSLRKC